MPKMMTSNGVRTLLLVVVALLGRICLVGAQQPEASYPSVERIRAALETPQQPINSNGVPLFAPAKPDEFHWGILTLVPPNTAGQFVSVRVPVGELVNRAAHSVAAAQHRRAENAAHAEVLKALAEFKKAQPK